MEKEGIDMLGRAHIGSLDDFVAIASAPVRPSPQVRGEWSQPTMSN